MLKIENLSIEYKDVIAVKDVSLSFESGKIYGLAGPNGAGKSSLLKAVTGIISEYNGQIYFESKLLNENRHHIKKLTGYAPENVELIMHLTAKELLHMIADIREFENKTVQIDHLLEIFELVSKQDDLISTFSHGMMQKMSIAAALTGEPKYLFMDEALNGIDPVSLFNLKKYIKQLSEKGHTIVISSHILELIEKWCDEIIIMHQGKILKQFSQIELKNLCRQNNKDFDEIFVELIQKFS